DGIRDRNVTGVQTCALPICRALHEVEDRTNPAELLGAPRPARAAVHEHRQGRAVPGGTARIRAVEHEDPAVARGSRAHELCDETLIRGSDRRHEGAPTARDEAGRLRDRKSTRLNPVTFRSRMASS